MREICTSGSVRGGDGNIPTYSALHRTQQTEALGEGCKLGKAGEHAEEA